MTNNTDATYLTIHAGHTRVKIGVFNTSAIQVIPEFRLGLSIGNDCEFPWKELEAELVDHPKIITILTGSNQHQVRQILKDWNPRFAEPLALPDKSSIPIQSVVDVPEKVGADRLLNAVAANRIREANRSALIVDTGTAITVDCVNADGQFTGGAILPGVLMGARAMHEFTTTLPLIDGRKFLETPPTPIGRNTEDAMASGLYWGHLGAVKELISRMSRQLNDSPQVFITGGALPILQPDFPEAICEPNLTLMGTVITAQVFTENSTSPNLSS